MKSQNWKNKSKSLQRDMGTFHSKFHSLWSKIHGNSLQWICNEKCEKLVKIHLNEFEMGNVTIHGNTLPQISNGKCENAWNFYYNKFVMGRCEDSWNYSLQWENMKIHGNSMQMNL